MHMAYKQLLLQLRGFFLPVDTELSFFFYICQGKSIGFFITGVPFVFCCCGFFFFQYGLGCLPWPGRLTSFCVLKDHVTLYLKPSDCHCTQLPLPANQYGFSSIYILSLYLVLLPLPPEKPIIYLTSLDELPDGTSSGSGYF